MALTSFPNPIVVVMAYNRPDSLRRLFNSLLRATYPVEVLLIISIDKSDTDAVVQLAESFEWPFGDKKVIVHPENLGLRNHSLFCGDFTEQYGNVVFLEDDIFVAPGFFKYALQAVEHYGNHPQIGGASLYSFQYCEQAAIPFIPIQESSEVYFLQFFASWGTILFGEPWKKFRAWYQQQPQILPNDRLPEGVKKYWSEKSWSKYFLKFLVDHDLYYAYPRVSLCTNFSDPGEHYAQLTAKYQVTLPIDDKIRRDFKPFEESLAVYDAFFEILPDRLNRLVPELADFDYFIDLNVTKEWDLYPQAYVLTAQSARTSVRAYAYQLKPAVMNVVHRLVGEDIVLCLKEQGTKGNKSQNTLYYHSYLSFSQIMQLLKRKVYSTPLTKLLRRLPLFGK